MLPRNIASPVVSRRCLLWRALPRQDQHARADQVARRALSGASPIVADVMPPTGSGSGLTVAVCARPIQPPPGPVRRATMSA